MNPSPLEEKAKGKTIILSTHQMEIAEKLCDDVCMINRSRKVLDGRLRDIRRSFSQNAVAVRLEGADRFPNDAELIASVREVGEEFEVLLNPGANPQTLLKRLVDSGAVISKFELVEPSLHDDQLWQLLATLPARQRAVLVLRYYEDMSEEQIAATLGCAPGTVKSQASRGLATLRNRLGPHYAALSFSAATERR